MQKGVHKLRVKLADGSLKTYIYAWRGGPRLLSTPNSPDFHIEYAAAILDQRKARSPKHTLARLIYE